MARGTEGHGNLAEQKKINAPRLGYLYPQLGAKRPQLGVKIPREKNKRKQKEFFLLAIVVAGRAGGAPDGARRVKARVDKKERTERKVERKERRVNDKEPVGRVLEPAISTPSGKTKL